MGSTKLKSVRLFGCQTPLATLPMLRVDPVVAWVDAGVLALAFSNLDGSEVAAPIGNVKS